MAVSFTEILDKASWSREHWKLFAVVSLNYVLDGVMFSIAPLIAYLIAPDVAPTIFALNLLSETAGAILLGRLADIYGRRVLFALSLTLEVIALLLLVPFYSNTIALAILTSLMTFGIGGEYGAAYATIAELTPAKHRGKALMMATNFWNIGATLIAGLALIYAALNENVASRIQCLLFSALGTAVAAGLVRIAFPESPRWLVLKGRASEAIEFIKKLTGYSGEISLSVEERSQPEIGLAEALRKYWFRFAILAVITIVQYVTYDVTAYYLPYAPGFVFGVTIVPTLVFVANLGASIGAFLLLPLIDYARRLSAFLAFLGGTLTAIAILVFHNLAHLPAFYAALFVNLMFSEWAWASLSVLQSELFPTGIRASIVGLLTGLTGISGATVVYIASFLDAAQYLAIIVTMWVAGLVAATLWYFRGVESARRSLEELV